MNKNESKTYDLPLRIFHWVFALLFLSAFIIAKTVDDESLTYSYHMLSGIMMVFLVLLRIIWGFIGSKYSRFSSFRLNPKDLLGYFSSLLNSKTKRYLGHNPASSYVAVLMFIFTLGLGVSGFLMSQRINKHFFEEIHELCANGFVVMVILHIAGVIFHQIKHQDGLIFSMLSGKKESLPGEESIASNRPISAVVFIILILLFGLYLKTNFNPANRVLNLFGTSITLGEAEEDEGDQEEEEDEDDE